MAFTDDVLQQAWQRSGGKCECQNRSHDHGFYACDELLEWLNRAQPGLGSWEARHKVVPEDGGDDSLENCEIVCLDCLNFVPQAA